ncbi:MAG: response regulator [Anaeromyxobacter sp.]
MPATLLIVDDDPSLRDRLALLLRNSGHRLLMAGNAVEALTHLAAGPVELVLADQRVPGLDGLPFLQIVRARHPGSLRVSLASHLDPDLALRAIDEGDVYGVLLKPIDAFELRVTLHHALEKLALERENRRLASILDAVRGQGPGSPT